ncbi:MAG: cytochrome-c peroxidase [Betaproteobacteria bacterium]
MHRTALLLVAALAVARPAAADVVFYTGEELQRIFSLGPWPPPSLIKARDPSNRVSGQPAAIELGRRLFFGARMSSNGYVACVTCHQTDRAWTDGLARAQAIGPSGRNTPALFNLRMQQWYGWSGGADNLWAQSIRPFLDPNEMDSSPRLVKRVFERDPELACMYRQAFGVEPTGRGETVLAKVGKALAAFQETLVTGRTRFDEFRDALARNDRVAARNYPYAAQRGLRLFVGEGRCIACHAGPNFSDGAFHATGVRAPAAVLPDDAGRSGGLRQLRESRYTLLSHHSDDRSSAGAAATRRALGEAAPERAFRTASLRNVAVTAPYMHNGQLAALRDVVRHYSTVDGNGVDPRLPQRLELSESEADDLIAFLETLTDGFGAERLRPAAATSICTE